MKAIVVYESMYGNTHRAAEAIADGLGEPAEVDVVAVSDASPEVVAGAGLLVVGAPDPCSRNAFRKSHKAVAEDARKHPEYELRPRRRRPPAERLVRRHRQGRRRGGCRVRHAPRQAEAGDGIGRARESPSD